MRLDTNELIERAERELAEGSQSAHTTLDRARQELLDQGDADGLEHLLELVGRLDGGGPGLTYAIQENLRWLSRQTKGKPDNLNAAERSLVALFGAFVGGVIGCVLAWALLAGSAVNALVWLAALIFFCIIGAPLGAGLAYGFSRLLTRSAKTDD